jgi:putative transposase
MNRTVLLRDRFAPAGNPAAYFEVLDPHPREGLIKVFDAGSRQDKYVEAAKILADVHTGKLTVLREGKPRYSLAAQPDSEDLVERLGFVRMTMRRIHDIQEFHGVSFLKAYQRAADEYGQAATQPLPPFPHRSTIYRYRKSELAGLPALRGDKNKGNRTPRYPEAVINTIWMEAEQHYLRPQSRWSIKRLTEQVNRSVRGAVMAPDCQPISAKYVKKVITQLVSVDPEHDRMLPDEAIAGKSYAKKRLRLESPFERVEQDAVHLPFVVKTPSGISSNIYLVHAIDCCTSYPMGWHLVIGSPTESDSLACIELFMAPLKAERFRVLGVNHGMNVCGTPGQLVFDNGPEAKGRRIENLQKLGVDVKYCRAKAAQEKPFVERLNRSLKEALEGLAGCTRVDGKDGQRDPVALGDTLMTLEELERWVVRWYYEKWIHTPLERLRWDVVLLSSLKGETPAARWKHHEASCLAISLPPSRAEWLAALYEHTERRVSRKTGISVDGLNFKGDGIAGLIAKYGEHRPVQVLFNPDDFRHVYVYEGDDFPLITLAHEHLRPETPAWSFKDAKERFASTKSGTAGAPEAERFDADMHERVVADSLAPRKRRRSKVELNRETRARDKEARAIERASTHPRPLPPPKATSTNHVGAAAAQPLPTNAGLGEAALLPVLNRSSGDRLK